MNQTAKILMSKKSGTRLNSYAFGFFAATSALDDPFSSFRISTGSFTFTALVLLVSAMFLLNKYRKTKTLITEMIKTENGKSQH